MQRLIQDVQTILYRRYNVLPLLKNLGRCGRDCDFKRLMQTLRRPVLGGQRNVEMPTAPPSDRGSL